MECPRQVPLFTPALAEPEVSVSAEDQLELARQVIESEMQTAKCFLNGTADSYPGMTLNHRELIAGVHQWEVKISVAGESDGILMPGNKELNPQRVAESEICLMLGDKRKAPVCIVSKPAFGVSEIIEKKRKVIVTDLMVGTSSVIQGTTLKEIQESLVLDL
jgi:hypothetical protein